MRVPTAESGLGPKSNNPTTSQTETSRAWSAKAKFVVRKHISAECEDAAVSFGAPGRSERLRTCRMATAADEDFPLADQGRADTATVFTLDKGIASGFDFP
jgi:hypothetical protein